MTKDEALDLALEALEGNTTNPIIDPDQAAIEDQAITAIKQARALDKKAENARELGLDYEPAQQEPVLQDIEQYRLQMAGISTAAIGYWKESDGIHPDYDTIALRDVAKLYAKYDELYRAQRTWVGLTDEEVTKMPAWIYSPDQDGMTAEEGLETFARAIEAKLREKNQ